MSLNEISAKSYFYYIFIKCLLNLILLDMYNKYKFNK